MRRRILMFAGENDREFLSSGDTFFVARNINSYPKQFSQLYTIHVNYGSINLCTSSDFYLVTKYKRTVIS